MGQGSASLNTNHPSLRALHNHQLSLEPMIQSVVLVRVPHTHAMHSSFASTPDNIYKNHHFPHYPIVLKERTAHQPLLFYFLFPTQSTTQ